MIQVDVKVESADWRQYIPRPTFWVRQVLRKSYSILKNEQNEKEVSVVLSNDEVIHALNRQYRQKDKATNVLAFPLQGESGMLGDIIIAFETCKAEAEAAHKEFRHHATHLLLHGFLHLLGYDHETDAEAEVMENQEALLLARFNIENPYC